MPCDPKHIICTRCADDMTGANPPQLACPQCRAECIPSSDLRNGLVLQVDGTIKAVNHLPDDEKRVDVEETPAVEAEDEEEEEAEEEEEEEEETQDDDEEEDDDDEEEDEEVEAVEAAHRREHEAAEQLRAQEMADAELVRLLQQEDEPPLAEGGSSGDGLGDAEEGPLEADPFRCVAARLALKELPFTSGSALAHDLCCPVCNDCVFECDPSSASESGVRSWLQLPCSHAVCSECGPKMAAAGNSTCPLCRASYLPPPAMGDRVRIIYKKPAAHEDEKKKSGGANAGRQRTLWELLKDELHGRSGLVVEDAGSSSLSVRLDEPLLDGSDGGTGIEVVRVPMDSLLRRSPLDPLDDEGGWPVFGAARPTPQQRPSEDADASLTSDETAAAAPEAATASPEQAAVLENPDRRSLDELRALGVLDDLLMRQNSTLEADLDHAFRCGACWLWMDKGVFSNTQVLRFAGRRAAARSSIRAALLHRGGPWSE